jgi:hypothetical protein
MNENYSYVKRFIEMPSFVSAERHQKDFELQQNYKKTISKANLHQRLVKLSSFVAKPGLLPPLEISISESEAKVRSQNESKLETSDEKDKKSVKSLKSEKTTQIDKTLKKPQNPSKLVDVQETQFLSNLPSDRMENYEDEHFEVDDSIKLEEKNSIEEPLDPRSASKSENSRNPSENNENPEETIEKKEVKPLNPNKKNEEDLGGSAESN